MKQYYIHDGIAEQGPFTVEELKRKSIQKETLVWYDGLPHWTSAEHVEELQELMKTIPPPLATFNRPITPPSAKPDGTYSTTSEYQAAVANKDSKAGYIVLGLIILVGIIGWLVYENMNQSETVSQLQQQVYVANAEASAANEAEGERRRRNIELTEKNMNYRNNWNRYFSVANSNYTYSLIGGVDPFDVTISNKTDYLVDEMIVTAHYYKSNGEPFKSEDIHFYNVTPNSTATERSQGSIRGVRVAAEITKIISKRMHFCYPSDNGNPADPYFCR